MSAETYQAGFDDASVRASAAIERAAQREDLVARNATDPWRRREAEYAAKALRQVAGDMRDSLKIKRAAGR